VHNHNWVYVYIIITPILWGYFWLLLYVKQNHDMLCHLADYNCLSDMIQLFVFSFFFFASTLVVFSVFLPSFHS
jgi:hypothetical protein